MTPCLAFSTSGMIHDIKSSTTDVRRRSRRIPPVANEVLILHKHLTIDFVSRTEMPTARSLLQSDLFQLSIHSMSVRIQTEKGYGTATSLHCSSWRKRVPQKPQTSPGCSRTYSCSSIASSSHQSGCISFLPCRCSPVSHQPPSKTPVKTLVSQQSPAITSARSQAPCC